MNESSKHTCIAMLTACMLAIGLLYRPISNMDVGLWGPADPWNNGDFLGAQWLFWAASQSGDPVSMLHWPWGEDPILAAFPNPFDAWLLGPLFEHIEMTVWWNGMMLAHHVLNVAASVVLARAAGARPMAAVFAGAVVASTPLMLHEHAIGHTLTAAVWPGLFGLAALLRGKAHQAGVWIGIQGLAYLYTGLFTGIVALILRPRRGLWTALVPMAPYLLAVYPQLEAATAVPPPDGFTALPLNAFWGGSSQPQLQLQPLVWLALLGLVIGAKNRIATQRRLLASAGVLLTLALGTELILARGEPPVAPSPMQWFFDVPGFERMHHPIRLGALAVPLLAATAAMAVQRLRSIWALAAVVACTLNWKTIDNTVSWPEPSTPPGADAAQWLTTRAEGVIDLGSTHMQALSLQTIHGKPILSGFHPRSRPHPNVDRAVFERVQGWAEGTAQPGLAEHLKRMGYTHVMLVDRGAGRTPDDSGIRNDLGPPVYAGVFEL